MDVTNTVKKGNITFKKVNTSGKGLKGAEFKIYEATDTDFENPIKAENADENGVVVSDDDGQVVFEDLDYNNYVIRETKAPSGYYRTSQSIKVEFQDFLEVENEDTEAVVVTLEDVKNNRIVYGRDTLELVKIGEDGESDYLTGAVFELLQNGEVKYTSEPTASDGRVTFTNLAYGTYTVREKEAPEGYTLDPEMQEISITTGGVLKTLTFINNKIRGNIKLIKTDDAETANLLPGAEFTLYDATGKKVKTAISNQNGEVLFENIAFGKYLIKETDAPIGYELNEEEYEVSITEDGVTIDKDVNGQALKITNKPIDEDPEEPTEPENPEPEEPTDPETPEPEDPEEDEEGKVEGEGPEDGEDPSPGTGGESPEDPKDENGSSKGDGPGQPGQSDGRDDEDRLPQTGEANNTLLYVIGTLFILVGLGIGRKKFEQ